MSESSEDRSDCIYVISVGRVSTLSVEMSEMCTRGLCTGYVCRNALEVIDESASVSCRVDEVGTTDACLFRLCVSRYSPVLCWRQLRVLVG